MENFNWTEFTKRIIIKSELALVYNAWTRTEELEKWFLSKAVFTYPDNTIIPSLTNVVSGSKYEWNWFAQNYFEQGKVLEANGSDFLEFTFAGNCKVQVKLKNENGCILVELTQNEIPLDDNSKENIRLGCAFGWTFYLINLKSILEGGIDLRNKDIELVGLVNN
ncbi:MAG: SRPBCC domain-containing protein [Bacteroidia bacterium]